MTASARRYGRAPQFPIAAILRALGADTVPEPRTGHAKLLCIFHPDNTPSASVSRYGFVCWACGEKGDAISLIRRHEGLDYAGAVARCEALTGVTDPDGGSEPRSSPSLLDL